MEFYQQKQEYGEQKYFHESFHNLGKNRECPHKPLQGGQRREGTLERGSNRGVVPSPDGNIYLVDIKETHYWGSF